MLIGAVGDAFTVFVTMIAMLNPIEAAAAFATLTDRRSAQDRARIARRASIVAGIALLSFAFVGEALLRALGVEIGAFKIAGGLLLLKVGFNMVFAEKTDKDTADEAKSLPVPPTDPSVFPLAIPIITGPGALTASVALVNPAPGDQLLNAVIFVVVAVLCIGITYLFMRASTWLTVVFGETGIDAVGRIVGIIVAAIAVQLIVNGIAGLTSLTIR
ncbi:MAG TPA: MarC family protein [Candidatus Cybelea sp.]|jgi:multiple antibiotic resistance protein|nr:MarC family protein [Candidatus Cybelea sp.]